MVTIGEGTTSLTRNAKKTTYLSYARDPFSASSAPVKGYAGPILGGIMWDKENPVAIINDNIVKIGDRVGDYIVVGIEQDKVILIDGSKNFELKLSQ